MMLQLSGLRAKNMHLRPIIEKNRLIQLSYISKKLEKENELMENISFGVERQNLRTGVQ